MRHSQVVGSPSFQRAILDVRALLLLIMLEVSRSEARFLWLNNFECEQFRADQGAVRLPSFSSPAENAIVHRLEEMFYCPPGSRIYRRAT